MRSSRAARRSSGLPKRRLLRSNLGILPKTADHANLESTCYGRIFGQICPNRRRTGQEFSAVCWRDFTTAMAWTVGVPFPQNGFLGQSVESRMGASTDARSAAPFPIPAHQTGRAQLRHPAFRLASPQTHERGFTLARLSCSTPSSPNTAWMLKRLVPRECTWWRLRKKCRTLS